MTTTPKPTGRRETWPTLWNKLQTAFPWGSPTRLRKRPAPKLSTQEMEQLEEELKRALRESNEQA